MCKYYAVIFDCDGVMFDSRQANINFYNNILKRLGLSDMTKEEEAYIHMHTVGESLHHILKDTPFEKMADNYSIGNDYFPFLKDMVMEPGLKELLSALKPDFRLGIATNRTTTIGEVLKINGIDTFFDIVVSSLDVKKIKPHPESLYKILDFLKIDPEQALYIGDSSVDAEMAKKAGVPFAAYKNDDLEATYHVKSHREIGHIVGVTID